MNPLNVKQCQITVLRTRVGKEVWVQAIIAKLRKTVVIFLFRICLVIKGKK